MKKETTSQESTKTYKIVDNKILVEWTYEGKNFQKIYTILKMDKVEKINEYLASGNSEYIFSDLKKLEEISAIQSRDSMLEDIAD